MKKFYTIILFVFVFIIANAQGTWTQKLNFGGAGRVEAVGFSIGSKGYIGTGTEPFPATYSDFWEWDQATNVWTQKADYGGGQKAAVIGFSIGTKGYIGTGNTGTSYEFWEWDQTTNIWTQKADFGGGAREFAVCFSIGKKGYIGTGNNSNGAYKDFWEWNGDTSSPTYNTWTQKANFGGTARNYAVGFSIGSKGYIGTGADADSSRSDFWEWNGDTSSPNYNTWTKKANFSGGARISAIGFSISNKGYIGTGNTYSTNFGLNDFWEWNQATNTWTQKANYGGGGVIYAVGFSIGGMGYIGTGSYGPNGNQDFWEYCDTCSGAGVNEINLDNLIEVYPNPTTANVQISGLENVKIKTINIFNVAGEKIYESANSHIGTFSHFQIDLSSQPSGVYFLQLKTEQGTAVKKIVVSK